MDLEKYKRRYPEPDEAAPGWDAIDVRLKAEYGEQEPLHWAPIVPMMLGGEDPLHGISAYHADHLDPPHLHFCTYGFTELFYDEEAAGGEFSRFGFELTFRLAKDSGPAEEDSWVGSLLQNLAKYVFSSGNWFEAHHWIPTNGPIKLETDTEIVGLALAPDPRLEPIDSPHGRVEFLQMFGITQQELEKLGKSKKLTKDMLDGHRQTNPLLITDLARKNG